MARLAFCFSPIDPRLRHSNGNVWRYRWQTPSVFCFHLSVTIVFDDHPSSHCIFIVCHHMVHSKTRTRLCFLSTDSLIAVTVNSFIKLPFFFYTEEAVINLFDPNFWTRYYSIPFHEMGMNHWINSFMAWSLHFAMNPLKMNRFFSLTSWFHSKKCQLVNL